MQVEIAGMIVQLKDLIRFAKRFLHLNLINLKKEIYQRKTRMLYMRNIKSGLMS